jgi:hypothetical protein
MPDQGQTAPTFTAKLGTAPEETLEAHETSV